MSGKKLLQKKGDFLSGNTVLTKLEVHSKQCNPLYCFRTKKGGRLAQKKRGEKS